MTHRSLLVSLASLGLAASLGAQVPRPSVQMDIPPAGEPYRIALATAGDVSASSWTDNTNQEIKVSVSDGQGLTWTSPLRLDSDTSGAFKSTTNGITVLGDKVFVFWMDERNDDPLTGGIDEESDLYLSVYDTATGTATAEAPVPKGYPAGTGLVQERRVAASSEGGVDYLYALQEVYPTPLGVAEVRLVASTDGGATWPVSTKLNTAGGVENIDLWAEGKDVYVAWRDDRLHLGLDDVFFRRSTDGGASFGPEVQLDVPHTSSADAIEGPRIAVRGSTVAVVWDETATFSSASEIRAAVSTDGGLNFNPSLRVGAYGNATAKDARVAITASGTVVFAWLDFRSGAGFETSTAISTDGGLSYSNDQQLTASTILRPEIVAAGDGEEMALIWQNTLGFDSVEAGYSHDGGVSWNLFFVDDHATDSSFFPKLEYNALYDNVMVIYNVTIGGPRQIRASGFRPQTLTPQGWSAGPTSAHFDFSNFPPSPTVAWALLSLSPGSLPIPGDVRDLGLAASPLLSSSVQLALGGIASATLAPDGSGSTPPVNVTLPPGLTLYGVGLALDPLAAPATVGAITDVVRIDL